MAEENFKQFKDEICHHFDVVGESLREEIKAVAEGVSLNTQKIENLQKDVSRIKDDVEIIKLDIEFIKHELKQKVSRDEFAALEKRVSMLEAKQS